MQQVAIVLTLLSGLAIAGTLLARKGPATGPLVAAGVAVVVGIAAMLAVVQLYGDVIPDGVEGGLGIVVVVGVSAALVAARLGPWLRRR